MIQIKPTNPDYWINSRALLFSENDLDDPNRVAVSLVSGTVIKVHKKGIIDYAFNGDPEKWTLKGYSTKLINPDAHYIYARLNRSDRNALIVFSVKNYDIEGGVVTVVGKDDEGNDITETSDPSADYFYIRIGDLTATDSVENATVDRVLTYDSGLLDTSEGNSKSDPSDMWELVPGVTPLIKAKHWLMDFTLKGFITLIGGLIFKNGNVEKPVKDIKRSIDDNEAVPINDETLPTTAWVESRTDDRYLKKYEPDETQHRIKFFDGIECGEFVEGPLKVLGGSGTQFDGDGYGEMNGLRLREFLEVPELRFNRVDVVSGILWNSVAFGLVETVDEASQRCRLKLEDGERSGLHVNDICMGIFSDFGDGTVEGVFDPETGEVLDPGDDENGLPKMYGFSTSYFTPTAIIQNDPGLFEFEYSLQPGTNVHPKPSMKFAVYGNFMDESRQASAYSTRTYKRYLSKVSTWKIDPDTNIYAQYGDLNNLTIGKYEMSGYGSFQSNVYITGGIFEFTPQQKLELKGEDAYSATLSDYVGIIRMDAEGNLIAGEYAQMNVVTGDENVVTSEYLLQTRVQAFKGTSELAYSEVMSEGCYLLGVSSVGCTVEVLNGVISVTGITSLEHSYVNITVNCEGNATFGMTYQVKVVKDGIAAIYADLSNEMDAVACTPEGLYLYGLPVATTVSMWNGTNRLELDSISLDVPEGVTASADADTGKIEITDVSDSSPRVIPVGIIVQATHAGEVHARSLVFTLNKVVQGDAGALYKLVPSETSVKFRKGELAVSRIVSARALEYNGKEVTEYEALPENMSITVSKDGEDGQPYAYGSDVEVSSANESVAFRLWRNGLLVDVVTVPIMVDGENPVTADLSNEMDAVSCTADGKYLYGLPLETSVSMWSGTDALEIKSVLLDLPSGVTAESDAVTGKVTVTGITDQAAAVLPVGISVSAEYDGMTHTRHLTFTVNKQNQGETGALYKLVPSVTDVKLEQSRKDDIVPVTCGVTWYDGREVSELDTLPDGMSMTYSISNGEEIPCLPKEAVEVSVSLSEVTFRLYKNGILLDVETVPVVIDGSSPVTASIENEMDSIACTADGAYLYGLPVSTVVGMWYGTEQMVLDGISVSAPEGVACTSDSGTGEVTVTEVADSAPKVLPVMISMKATRYGVQYVRNVVLTVNKQTQGEAGALYRLVPSSDVVKVDKQSTDHSYPVRCTVTWYNGKEVTEYDSLPEGMSMTYAVGDGAETTYAYGQEIAVSSSSSKVVFRLYMGTMLLDIETVPVILDGNSAFKSTVFLRSNEEPGTPTGGSYEDPMPVEDGWQDGIPRGEEILWASTRVFSIDGLYPQQDAWSKPSSMTSTSAFLVMYSEVEINPGNPDSSPSNWSESPSTDTWWMATNVMTNGVWSGWKVSQIKGEKGSDGADGADGKDGADGENAKYYIIEAAVGSIGYTMTGGYSPSSFVVREYLINGDTRTSPNTYYIHVYGIKNGKDTHLTYTGSADAYTFNASSWISDNYDAFRFDLRVSSSSSSSLVNTGTTVTVAVAKQGTDGEDGANGADGVMPRYCGKYNSSTTYIYGNGYRDIVVYNGNVFQVASYGLSVIDSPPPTTATSNSKWEVANKFGFVAMDTALIDGANIAGFAFKNNVMLGGTDIDSPTLKLDGVNGEITALAGNIGGFTIGERTLTNTSAGNASSGASIRVYNSSGTRYAYLNGGAESYSAEFRNDSGSAVRIEALGGSSNYGLEILGNGNSRAIQSTGTCVFSTRTSKAEHTYVSGLSVSVQSGLSWTRTSTDNRFAAGNTVDFLILTGNSTLPDASHNKGRIVFVKFNGYTLVGQIVPRHGKNHVTSVSHSDLSAFYISDGIYWYEFLSVD